MGHTTTPTRGLDAAQVSRCVKKLEQPGELTRSEAKDIGDIFKRSEFLVIVSTIDPILPSPQLEKRLALLWRKFGERRD